VRRQRRSLRGGALARAALACLAAGALAAALAPAGVAAQERPGTVIREPSYGEALFHFFQDDSFGALTSLMVSQHFGRLALHADEAEMLRGGLLLSYGLHREAGDVFAALVGRPVAPSVRDRAWFHLARMRHQRGLHGEALDALARVGDALPADLAEERALLRAQLMLARGDAAAAAQGLAELPPATAAGRYVRFNLGVAWVRAGEPAKGHAVLEELGRASAPRDEDWALRDRANLALGFAALADQQPEAARAALERVRLVGPSANKALLGFGWAAAALKQPKQALVPWLELAARPADDEAVLEARLAVPYAYAEAGAAAQALKGYQDALAAFAHEDRRLDETIAAVRRGALVDALLERHRDENAGRLGALQRLPGIAHAGQLGELLATHEFQESFNHLRDLRFLAGHLQAWTERLGTYADMLALRRQAYAERLPKVLEAARPVSVASVQQRRDALAATLHQAEVDGDGRAFADARQVALAERVARVRAAPAAPAAAPDDDRRPELDGARWRARLAAGALTWELARDLPARRWEASRSIAQIDRLLDQARAHERALQQAQRDEPARFEAFERRLAALDARLRSATPQVQRLAAEQQAALQELAVARLQQQKARLVQYAAQARFAVAQLVDRAQAERVAGAGPATQEVTDARAR
jgi:hypothetical protein